jgi:hypothetical protein
MSQKSVDYSIKALQCGKCDFSTTFVDTTFEMGSLHHDVKEIARDLMLTRLSSESDIRFVSTSVRISDALRAIHKEAFEISLLLQNEREINCADLTTRGDLANRLMRLCTVAIFEEEVAHAEAVLRAEGARLVTTTASVWHGQLDRIPPSKAVCVLSIAERLDELIRQMREMARAIVFWIDGNKRESFPGTYGFQPAEFLAAGSRSVNEFELDHCI